MPSAAKELAPGIPADRGIQRVPTVKRPKEWEFGIHSHQAERAGQHFDLRLGDPSTGRAHSWALRNLPNPGETRLAVQQPTHTLAYMDFTGRIGEGYGKGDVELARRDKTEVLSADDNHVRFNVYSGRNIEEFALRRTRDGNNWILQNVTTSRAVGPGKLLPSSKPAYRTVKEEQIDVSDPKTELQAKIDGAHVLYQFKSPGSTPRVHSYRPTERATGIIEHTHKLPGFASRVTPAGLKDTILRGELYAVDKDGRALPAAQVGGLLNAGVLKSREKQRTQGVLVPVVFDVARWKGEDVEDKPYSVKKKLLDAALKLAPWLKKPRTASTPEQKAKLLSDIKEGKEPSTEEGVIEWHEDKAVPRKAKFLEERDVYVRNIFAEEGVKRRGTMAGGFEFSTSLKGPIIGRVGTGMSHSMKKDMLDNPSKYEGLKARVRVQRAPAHYAPRAPAFLSFHLEQDLPEELKVAAHGSIAGGMHKSAQKPIGIFRGEVMSPDTVKFRTEFCGIPVHIDRPRGFVMKGEDSAGKPWTRRYKYNYGFIPRTKGGDGEQLDVFIGSSRKCPDAFWAIQTKDDGSFDEYKVFLGFDNRDEAMAAYRAHIPKKLLKGMVTMRIDMMKAMLGLDATGFSRPKTAMVAASFMDEIEKIAFGPSPADVARLARVGARKKITRLSKEEGL